MRNLKNSVFHLQGKVEAEEGADWVLVLEGAPYRELSLEGRVAGLCALCHAAMEGPGVRAAMDARVDEGHNRRRLVWEEAKVSLDFRV